MIDIVDIEEVAPGQYCVLSAWVPWANIDAIPGEDMAKAIVATPDNVTSRWGLATVVERDGQHLRSPISPVYIPQPATAVATMSWGRVKSASK